MKNDFVYKLEEFIEEKIKELVDDEYFENADKAINAIREDFNSPMFSLPDLFGELSEKWKKLEKRAEEGNKKAQKIYNRVCLYVLNKVLEYGDFNPQEEPLHYKWQEQVRLVNTFNSMDIAFKAFSDSLERALKNVKDDFEKDMELTLIK